MTMKSFDTDGEFKNNYKFLIGSIVPRPIAVVSTLNEDGTNNLAPFSFFTAVSASPMIIAFCPFIRTSDGKKKDTLVNVEREKEFVVNFASSHIASNINNSSAELPYGSDEFSFSKLTPTPSEVVRAKRVQESLIQFECKLRDIISYGDTPGSGTLVTGEVLKVHVDESILEEGKINTDQFRPIGRGAGSDWILCDNRIQLERPKKQ